MRLVFALGISAFFGGFGTLTASAQLPDNQTIEWNLRLHPDDPQSEVQVLAVVTLTAWEVDGNAVGWTVASVQFHQPSDAGEKIWIEENPPLDTPDGLWWITHLDPLQPSPGEFLDTPTLKGRAFAEDPQDVDLLYEISSTAVPGEEPTEETSDVSYVLAAAEIEEPTEEPDDEPVETHDTEDMD